MREFFMKAIKMLALALVLIGATTAANASTAFLAADDFVGISFWLISMGNGRTTHGEPAMFLGTADHLLAELLLTVT